MRTLSLDGLGWRLCAFPSPLPRDKARQAVLAAGALVVVGVEGVAGLLEPAEAAAGLAAPASPPVEPPPVSDFEESPPSRDFFSLLELERLSFL